MKMLPPILCLIVLSSAGIALWQTGRRLSLDNPWSAHTQSFPICGDNVRVEWDTDVTIVGGIREVELDMKVWVFHPEDRFPDIQLVWTLFPRFYASYYESPGMRIVAWTQHEFERDILRGRSFCDLFAAKETP